MRTSTIKLSRAYAGCSTGTFGETTIRIMKIDPRDFGDTGEVIWNLFVNEVCDDTYLTLRDAKVAAAYRLAEVL